MTYLTKSPPRHNNVSSVAKVPDIIARHWPDEDLAGFAQEAAQMEFGGSWVHPADRDFTDRKPPGASAAAKPNPTPALDIVSALRLKRNAA